MMNKAESIGPSSINYLKNLSIENKITTAAYVGITALSLYFLYSRYQINKQNSADEAWISKATEGENRYEAMYQLRSYIKYGGAFLDLSDLGLTEFPPNLERLSSINTLNISNNKITIIPPEIKKLNKLHVLNIQNNRLERLPECFRNLSLTRLNLSGNEGLDPSKLILPHTLKTLKLASLGLEGIHNSIFYHGQLSDLDLSNNQLREVSNSIGYLYELESLNLANNQLTDLPDQVGELRALRKLDVRNNSFDVLPDCIRNLHEDCVVQHSIRVPSPPRRVPSPPRPLRRSGLAEHLRPQPSLGEAHQAVNRYFREQEEERRINEHPRNQTIAEEIQRNNLVRLLIRPLQPPAPTTFHRLAPIFRRNPASSLFSHRDQTQTLEGCWRFLNQCAGSTLQLAALSLSDADKNNLGSFLRNLFNMRNFKTDESNRLAKKVVEFFRLAIKDPNFKEKILAMLAVTSCEDSVAVTIIKLGIEKELHEIGTDDLKAVERIIGGRAWPIKLLAHIAVEIGDYAKKIKEHSTKTRKRLTEISNTLNSGNPNVNDVKQALIEANEIFTKFNTPCTRTRLPPIRTYSIPQEILSAQATIENLLTIFGFTNPYNHITKKTLQQNLSYVISCLLRLESCDFRIEPDLLETQLALILNFPTLQNEIKSMNYVNNSLVTFRDVQNAYVFLNEQTENRIALYTALLDDERWITALRKNYSDEMTEIENAYKQGYDRADDISCDEDTKPYYDLLKKTKVSYQNSRIALTQFALS